MSSGLLLLVLRPFSPSSNEGPSSSFVLLVFFFFFGAAFFLVVFACLIRQLDSPELPFSPHLSTLFEAF